MSDDEEEQIELHQPLEILRSTARRLMERQIPASPGKLEEMYSHLKGAIGDSIDQVSSHISRALALTQDNLPEDIPVDSEAGQVVQQAELVLAEVQEELQEALAQIKQSFFAAASFQECEARLPNLALFESRLEKSLLRLEEAVTMVDNPDIFGLSTYEPAPTIPEALEALAEGLDHIHAHLQDGNKEPLRLALEAVQKAQIGLSAALAQE
ncbi:hypothetical protein IV102_02950 [bacterium]|nr:hypothetical protein [bacterium]